MLYKIKITTYKDGHTSYTSFVKWWWGWEQIKYPESTREAAIKHIDFHYAIYLSEKKVDIQLEYIEKPE